MTRRGVALTAAWSLVVAVAFVALDATTRPARAVVPRADPEVVTVAARDNIRPDRLVPGDTSNISSIVFRIKGADLAAYRAGRMTLEEAHSHVEIKQF